MNHNKPSNRKKVKIRSQMVPQIISRLTFSVFKILGAFHEHLIFFDHDTFLVLIKMCSV